jgi:hypothetical protein
LKLGVFTFFALKAVHYGLASIYALTETHEEPKRFGVCTVSQETEDGRSLFPHPPPEYFHLRCKDHLPLTTAAVNPESLTTLATSTNYDIRNAAIKILVDRFLSIPAARSSLSADLDSSDPAIRDVARRTVKLLERHADCYHSQHLQTLKRQAGLDRQECSASHEPLMRADWTWSSSETRMRQREESPEEQARRRNRREAIVLNDSDRPVTQDDIIQRVDSGSRNTTRR